MVSKTDHSGKEVEGEFCGDEIQRISRDEHDDVYEIEKIICQKKKDGRIWYLVKWLHINK